jgi:hypothetical protein
MKLLKVIGEEFELASADQHIPIKNCFNIGLVILTLSNYLSDHLKLVKLGIKTKDVKLAIIIESSKIGKFKTEDLETNLDRIVFICNQFENNGLNLNFNIYGFEKEIPFLEQEISKSFWTFKDKWIGDKKQIMVKKSSSFGYDSFGFRTRNINLKMAYDYAEKNNLEIVEFDYADRFANVLENMIHSKFVISERSGLMVMAAFAKVPVYLVSEQRLCINIDNEERLLTWGNGNLTTSSRIEHIEDGNIEQSYFKGKIYNVTTKDTL